MIIANLATYPLRRENLLPVVQAIAPQVDQLNVVLNQYDAELPELVDIPNVKQIIPHEDTKDVGKFYPDVSDADFVFMIDDDLIYPADFVERSVASLTALGPSGFMGGYHASLYMKPSFSLSPKKLIAWARYADVKIADYRAPFRFYETLGTADSGGPNRHQCCDHAWRGFPTLRIHGGQPKICRCASCALVF